MTNGALAALTVGCVLVGCGLVITATVLRNHSLKKEREMLTTVELQAVEESAVLLIQRLQEEASAVAAEIDGRLKMMRNLINQADEKLAELRAIAPEALAQVATGALRSAPARPESAEYGSDVERILAAARCGMGAADIARKTGVDRAAVGLILSLFSSEEC
ncbi:MAG: hypothetical protein ACP5R5_06320 [Armatimonadota bacterium]